MSDMVLDQRLRPAVEGYSALTAGACAAVAAFSPSALMLPPELGWVLGGSTLAFAAFRGRQAWRILEYRYGIKNYKLTRMAPHRIPASPEHLYLGQGFAWGQPHTQRKIDATAPEAVDFLRPSRRMTPPDGAGPAL